MACRKIKYDIVVVHGIGNEDGKKFGFSDKLKNLVVSRCAEAKAHWFEAPWEELNDSIDNEIRIVTDDLLGGYLQEATVAALKGEPTVRLQEMLPTGIFSKFFFWLCRKIPWLACVSQRLMMVLDVYLLMQAKKVLPSVLDALIDLPLYMGPERANLVRDEVRKAFRQIPEESEGIVLVGHSLGSVIAFDLFAEEIAKAGGVAKCRIKKLVTFGSPLEWVTRIRKAQVFQGSSLGYKTSVGDGVWVNFYDKEDPVCSRRALDEGIFAGVENIPVQTKEKFIKAHCAYWDCHDIADRIVAMMQGRECASSK